MLCRTQRQFLHCSCNSHVAETSFFFHILRIISHNCHIPRENTIFHTRQIDIRKFKTFRAVQSHQKYAVITLFHRIDICYQCHFLQKSGQTWIFCLILVRRCFGYQLIDIFDTCFCFIRIFCFKLFHITCLFNQLFQQLFYRQILYLATEFLNEFHERTYFCTSTTKCRDLFRLSKCLIKTDTISIRIILHLSESCRTDTTFWYIDDPFDCYIVFRIINGLHISKQILNFFSRIEVYTAYDLIRNICNQEFFLKQTGLGVGTIQNRTVLIIIDSFPDFLADRTCNIFCFFIPILKLTEMNGSSFFICRP